MDIRSLIELFQRIGIESETPPHPTHPHNPLRLYVLIPLLVNNLCATFVQACLTFQVGLPEFG